MGERKKPKNKQTSCRSHPHATDHDCLATVANSGFKVQWVGGGGGGGGRFPSCVKETEMLEKSGAMASVEVSYPKSCRFSVIWHPADQKTKLRTLPCQNPKQHMVLTQLDVPQ